MVVMMAYGCDTWQMNVNYDAIQWSHMVARIDQYNYWSTKTLVNLDKLST